MPMFTGVDGTKKEITSLFTSIDGTKREITLMQSGNDGVVETIFSKKANYVAVGESGTILYSRDGITWEPAEITLSLSAEYTNAISFTFVKCINGRWFASGTQRITIAEGASLNMDSGRWLYSDDGRKWIEPDSASGIGPWICSMYYVPDVGVLVGDDATNFNTSFDAVSSGDVTLFTDSVLSETSEGDVIVDFAGDDWGRALISYHEGTDQYFVAGQSVGNGTSYVLPTVIPLDGTQIAPNAEQLPSLRGSAITGYNLITGATASLWRALPVANAENNGCYVGQCARFDGTDKNGYNTFSMLAGGVYFDGTTQTYFCVTDATQIYAVKKKAEGIFFAVNAILYQSTGFGVAATTVATLSHNVYDIEEDETMSIVVGAGGMIATSTPLTGSNTFTERESGVTVQLNAVAFADY